MQRNDKDKTRLAPPGRERQNGIRGSTQEDHWGGSFCNVLVVESQDFALYFLHVLYVSLFCFCISTLTLNITKINIKKKQLTNLLEAERREKTRKLASLAEPVRIRDAFQAHKDISGKKFALKKKS